MRDIEDLVAKGSGSVGCCTAPRAGTKRGAPPSPEATKRWKPLARTMLAATKKGTGERRLYRGEELRGVHLELTDQCNASCPQCSRNDSGGAVNPLLSLTELRLGDVQAILPVALLQQLRRVMLCGNYGDPIVAKDCKEILRWMQKASPDTRLSMHTNGGARTASWWRDLGSIMRGANFVRFGIDGLEDTNHLYRQKVKWPTLMRNIRAFVSGGGHAQWDYLVFEHNEHPARAHGVGQPMLKEILVLALARKQLTAERHLLCSAVGRPAAPSHGARRPVRRRSQPRDRRRGRPTQPPRRHCARPARRLGGARRRRHDRASLRPAERALLSAASSPWRQRQRRRASRATA